ncbi:rRNA methyltransferase 2, mitochondrial [Galendromus occidentalis]|uniref:rRNA methyltransferase 2, mitochondrial n=1 Tax=Galendromus occidentalis TaxID=34638 RepID=A0AAJ6QN52_9ACAR|nr:rRNA methyltransferase 2, mitochondrial [Galendromus occidentalis]
MRCYHSMMIRYKTAQDWLSRQLNDPYVKKSRYHNYRARSAFKLLEMDEKYNLLRPGMTVIDCGAAPGSWTQVLVPKVNADRRCEDHPVGKVISIDVVPFEPVPHANCYGEVDFLDDDSVKRVLEDLGAGWSLSCDLVVSDMAPNASGVAAIDHEKITVLSYAALVFALKTLKPGGGFICKLWHGSRTPELKADLKTHFNHVHIVKPDASRGDSAEIFFVAERFRGVK